MKSLPEINLLPTHKVHLNVMDKDILFSPFNVQQEKALINALEDNKTDDIIRNYENILKSCLKTDIDWDNLSVIDYMTLIINIRAKSKGESLELSKNECENCKSSFEFSVNIEDSLKFKNIDVKRVMVEIIDGLSLEIVPLNYKFLYGIDDIKDEMDLYVHTTAYSISKVIYEENIFKPSPDELKEKLIKNLSRKNLEKIFKECQKLISSHLEINFVCPNCGHEEEMIIRDYLKL